jgi:hypothetical protein
MERFARTIDAAKKYVVSSTLDRVDWNAEIVRGDLRTPFSSSSGTRVRDWSWLAKLSLALAELGLIDEYEFVVQPGPRADVVRGLSKPVDLRLVSQLEFGSGAVAMRYESPRIPDSVSRRYGNSRH